jgi:hypothetical protein
MIKNCMKSIHVLNVGMIRITSRGIRGFGESLYKEIAIRYLIRDHKASPMCFQYQAEWPIINFIR